MFTSSRNMIVSFILLVVCSLLGYTAFAVGIDDNPPGIGLALLSTLACVLAFVHSLRTSKQFRYLLYASGIGFVLSVILHNVFEGIASTVGETSVFFGLFNGAGIVFFIMAIFVCPIALLIGSLGAAITSNRELRSKGSSSTP